MCVTFKALNDERERYLSLSSPLLLSQLFHFASSFAALTADSMITITFSSVHNVIKSQCLKYVFNIILVVIQPLLTLTDICWRSLLLPYWIPFSLSTKIPFSFAKKMSCKKRRGARFYLADWRMFDVDVDDNFDGATFLPTKMCDIRTHDKSREWGFNLQMDL